MKSLYHPTHLILLAFLTLLGCDVGNVGTSAGNDSDINNSVINESKECNACGQTQFLEDNFGLDTEDCDEVCITCKEDPDDIDKCTDCKAGCETNNEGEYQLAYDRCRADNLCPVTRE